jgi:hypothetical protein
MYYPTHIVYMIILSYEISWQILPSPTGPWWPSTGTHRSGAGRVVIGPKRGDMGLFWITNIVITIFIHTHIHTYNHIRIHVQSFTYTYIGYIYIWTIYIYTLFNLGYVLLMDLVPENDVGILAAIKIDSFHHGFSSNKTKKTWMVCLVCPHVLKHPSRFIIIRWYMGMDQNPIIIMFGGITIH